MTDYLFITAPPTAGLLFDRLISPNSFKNYCDTRYSKSRSTTVAFLELLTMYAIIVVLLCHREKNRNVPGLSTSRLIRHANAVLAPLLKILPGLLMSFICRVKNQRLLH